MRRSEKFLETLKEFIGDQPALVCFKGGPELKWISLVKIHKGSEIRDLNIPRCRSRQY